MDQVTLLALARGAESEQAERKERLKGKKDEICQAICAFANDFPRTGQSGVVVIGQADSRKPTGLPITDGLLLELADLRTNGGILFLLRSADGAIGAHQYAVRETYGHFRDLTLRLLDLVSPERST